MSARDHDATARGLDSPSLRRFIRNQQKDLAAGVAVSQDDRDKAAAFNVELIFRRNK